MKFLKEVLNLGRFFWGTPKEYKNIIFYSEHGGYYPNFEGLIKELTEKHRQTICYVTSDLKDPIFKSSKENVRIFYFKSLLSLFMGMVKSKVFVMTMPDLNQFYLKRSMNPVHYIYVFHSPVSTHLAYLPGAFDYYDSLLCIGPYQVREIRKYEKMHDQPEKELVEAGYYRIERIFADFKKYREGKKAGEDKITILIAPSWGVANVLVSCGEPLCELLLDAGYKVIVRPHPETVRRTPEVPKALEKKFGYNPGSGGIDLRYVRDGSGIRPGNGTAGAVFGCSL